jgi:hypothetical protein
MNKLLSRRQDETAPSRVMPRAATLIVAAAVGIGIGGAAPMMTGSGNAPSCSNCQ